MIPKVVWVVPFYLVFFNEVLRRWRETTGPKANGTPDVTSGYAIYHSQFFVKH